MQAVNSSVVNMLFGIVSLFFRGMSQIIGGVAIAISILTYCVEKPVRMEGFLASKIYDPHFKIFFFILGGCLCCLNYLTLFGGLIAVCGGLFYVYLFYIGEIANSAETHHIRITEEDLKNLQIKG